MGNVKLMKLLDKLTGKEHKQRMEEAETKLAKSQEMLAEARLLLEEAENAKADAIAESNRAEETKREVEAMLKAIHDAQEESQKQSKSPKEIATEKGEPWVDIISIQLDPDVPGDGAFELDWNDKFLANLVKAGYKGKTDADIVDQWFSSVCKNILQENYEQWEANYISTRRMQQESLDNGRSSIS